MSASNQKKVDWVHRIILPCAEVARLLSRSIQPPLSLRKRIALRVHMILCRFCSRYQRQLQSLRLALHRHPSDAEVPASSGLSAEARDRIRRSLRK